MGVTFAGPERFTDNGNGTVTDNWTGLVWMKNASYDEDVADGFDSMDWEAACTACATLKSNEHDLTDGSAEGDWRLPNVRELQSLVDYGEYNRALPAGHPFVGVKYVYWSSTTTANNTNNAWNVHFYYGSVASYGSGKGSTAYVWCVRGGK